LFEQLTVEVWLVMLVADFYDFIGREYMAKFWNFHSRYLRFAAPVLFLIYGTGAMACDGSDLSRTLNVNSRVADVVSDPLECTVEVTNAGTLKVASGWILVNSVHVDTTSSLSNNSSLTVERLFSSGVVYNSGSINRSADYPVSFQNDGVFYNVGRWDGRILNNGYIYSSGSAFMDKGENRGTLFNAGSVSVGNNYFQFHSDGILRNSGLISNSGLIQTNYYGGVQNKGTIVNSGFMDFRDGALINEGNLLNQGSIFVRWGFNDGGPGFFSNSAEVAGIGSLVIGSTNTPLASPNFQPAFGSSMKNTGLIRQGQVFVTNSSSVENLGGINASIIVDGDSNLKSWGQLSGDLAIKRGNVELYIDWLTIGNLFEDIDILDGTLAVHIGGGHTMHAGDVHALFGVTGSFTGFDKITSTGLLFDEGFGAEIYRDADVVYVRAKSFPVQVAVPEPDGLMLALVGVLFAAIVPLRKSFSFS
jgi:hypothetical protein